MAAAAILIAGGLFLAGRDRAADRAAPLAVFGSIPLIFAEGSSLSLEAPAPWPRAVLARHGQPVALDALTGPDGRDPLAGITRLVLAQPRALSPAENVALDAFVRRGGTVLMLIDPLYTGHSDLALGDPRRPQALAMLGPVLAHWGLTLDSDPQQRADLREARAMGLAVPVDLPGRFGVTGGAPCRIWDDGLMATCALGKGRVMALADATVLDPAADDAAHRRALDGLLTAAFAAR